MEFRVHTKAILYNKKGEILIQKRTDTGKRDLIGGKTELPEKIEDAILREIEEETGIKDLRNLDIIHLESSFSEEKNRYFVLIIFKGTTNTKASKISNEHQEFRWVTKEELFSIGLTEYLQKALEKIKNIF